MAQLLRCGAAVDAADEEGCTPLHHALLGLEDLCLPRARLLEFALVLEEDRHHARQRAPLPARRPPREDGGREGRELVEARRPRGAASPGGRRQHGLLVMTLLLPIDTI